MAPAGAMGLLIFGATVAFAAPATIAVDAGPAGVTAAAGKVYVANNGASSVSVLDAASETVISTVNVTIAPIMVAVDPVQNRGWSSAATHTDVIDLSSNSVIATLDLHSISVAVDPVLRRVYETADYGGLRILDADTNDVLSTIPPTPGGTWWGLAVNSVTHRVYVTDIQNESVVVIDGQTAAVLATIPMPLPSRFGIAVDEGANRIYVASYPNSPTITAGPLRVIDGTTNAVVGSVPMPGYSLGVAVDSLRHRVYVTNRNQNSVTVVDTQTLAVLGTRSTESAPFGVAVDAASGKVFVANGISGTVSVIPPDGLPVIDAVAFTPSQPHTNDVLTVSVISHDPNPGAVVSYLYQWQKNGQDVIFFGNSPSMDLSRATYGDRGDVITLIVRAVDAVSESAPVSISVTILDSAPVLPVANVGITPAAPHTNDVLAASVAASDVDGDVLIYLYQWQRNGLDIVGATGPTLDLAAAGNGDSGDVITLIARASDGTLVSEPASTNVTVVYSDTPPTASVTLSSVTPRAQDVLTATVQVADADHDVVTLTYVWRVSGKIRQTVTTTATTNSFDLRHGMANNGDVITVEVSATDGTLSAPVTTAAATVTQKK
jgi:YVTN family beta-propeller protein